MVSRESSSKYLLFIERGKVGIPFKVEIENLSERENDLVFLYDAPPLPRDFDLNYEFDQLLGYDYPKKIPETKIDDGELQFAETTDEKKQLSISVLLSGKIIPIIDLFLPDGKEDETITRYIEIFQNLWRKNWFSTYFSFQRKISLGKSSCILATLPAMSEVCLHPFFRSIYPISDQWLCLDFWKSVVTK
jgi:hypothetical protein